MRRHLHIRDNLRVLREMPSGHVDLIYLDPPFNSNVDYNAPFKDKAQTAAFVDAWHWTPDKNQDMKDLRAQDARVHSVLNPLVEGMRGNRDTESLAAYLVMMAPRLLEMRRVMKDTASLYLHCDPHADGYLRVLMDSIFGAKNFRNQVIWRCTSGVSGFKTRANRWVRNHDTILYYVKGRDYTFHKEYTPHRDYHRATAKTPGVRVDDVWVDVLSMQYQSVSMKEGTGFPTQKPTALLNRIIAASSNPGDLVLDPFCGCGTTIEACESMKDGRRNWIGIDIGYGARKVIFARLKKNAKLYKGIRVFHPQTEDQVAEYLLDRARQVEGRRKGYPEDLKSKEIRIVRELGGIPNPMRGGDGGIDGRFPLKFEKQYGAIQVKWGRATVDQVKAFGSMIQSGEFPLGIFVSFDLKPTPEMLRAQTRCGTYEMNNKRFPRLCFVHCAEAAVGWTHPAHADADDDFLLGALWDEKNK